MAGRFGPRVDLSKSDKPFGSWQVLRLGDHLPNGGWMWWCRCLACGQTERQVHGGNLRSGLTKDCGCGRRKTLSASKRKHGETGSPTYSVWRNMIARCGDPSNKSYRDYGAKGVRVHESWLGEHGYEQFVKDVGHKPYDNATIERKEVTGNYEPGNVTWIPRGEQNKNKRNSVLVTHNGQTKTLTEWAADYGIGSGSLHFRYVKKKMPFAEALATPNQKVRRKFEYQGKSLGLGELGRLVGIDKKVLYSRLVLCGWTVDEAVSTPVVTPETVYLTHGGETKTVGEWAKTTGISEPALRARLKKGWSVEQALTVPTAASINKSLKSAVPS